MKKIISALLSFTILFSIVYIGNKTVKAKVYADSFGKYTYEENSAGATITGYSGNSKKVYIPSKIEGKNVISIEPKAFNNEKNVEYIIIKNTELTIKKNAFYNCKKLLYAYIYPTVNASSQAFSGCSSLKTVVCRYKGNLWNNLKGKSFLISAFFDRGYTGKALTPAAAVNYYGKSLVRNKDYKEVYSNNINYGTGNCRINFIGKFRKVTPRTVNFNICPSKTVCYATSESAKKLRICWDKKTNAGGYIIQYSTSKYFSNNVMTRKITDKSISEIIVNLNNINPQNGNLYYVRIRTYKAVKGKTYYSCFSKDKVRVYYSDSITYKANVPREMKGVWVSYIDLALGDGDRSYSAFKKKFDRIASVSKSKGYNTLIVQVRPFCDSLYYSDYFPNSHIISGRQGVIPGYDPLEYMVKKAHSVGMSIQAWINPYRIKEGGNPKTLSGLNPYIENTDIGVKWNNGIYLNPGLKESTNLIVKGVTEIVHKYNVDGIQFDDYFYPTTSKKFDEKQYTKYKNITKNPKSLSVWRKNNVNTMVKSVYSAIKKINPSVQMGISPQGYYSNNSTLYADVKTWCEKAGYVDYICPQIYWSMTNPNPNFDSAMKDWTKLKFHSGLKFYVGLAGYKAGSKTADCGTWSKKSTILRIEYQRAKNVYKAKGMIFYRYGNLVSRQSSREVANLTEVLILNSNKK